MRNYGKANIRWIFANSIDKTNLEDIYSRNKIRHEIVEKLSDEERKNYIKIIDEENEKLLAIKNKIESSINLEKVDEILSLNEEEFVIALNMLVKSVDPTSKVSKSYCKEIRKALKSKYCTQEATAAFEDLIEHISAKYILLSYTFKS